MSDTVQEKTGLIVNADGKMRCFWPGELPDYIAYHDNEWGVPVTNDHRLFEKICLEGFQSGLSWLTILRKRENFRAAFDGFDFHRVALYDDKDIERLLADKGIVRHRGKIVSTINNAKRAIELVKEKVRSLLISGPLSRVQRIARKWWIIRPCLPIPQRLPQPGFLKILKTRLVFRGADHRLRFHAGHGTGQRPH